MSHQPKIKLQKRINNIYIEREREREKESIITFFWEINRK